jgi:hypothetical protein
MWDRCRPEPLQRGGCRSACSFRPYLASLQPLKARWNEMQMFLCLPHSDVRTERSPAWVSCANNSSYYSVTRVNVPNRLFTWT